jgi:hypothetical protein
VPLHTMAIVTILLTSFVIPLVVRNNCRTNIGKLTEQGFVIVTHEAIRCLRRSVDDLNLQTTIGTRFGIVLVVFLAMMRANPLLVLKNE